MADQSSGQKRRQIERAKRLRKQIESLKGSSSEVDEDKDRKDGKGKERGKSLKEQIQEREAEQKRSTGKG